MRAAVVGDWVIVTGGWALFRTLREQVLTPALARQVAEWCEGSEDFESAAELRWAAAEAEKWCPEPEGGQPVEQADDIIARIDALLSTDAMSWSPVPEGEAARILAGEQDERPRPLPVGQIHAISVADVPAWRDWWDTLSDDDQADTPWYVVCFGCMAVGERSVDCECGNPSSERDSR